MIEMDASVGIIDIQGQQVCERKPVTIILVGDTIINHKQRIQLGPLIGRGHYLVIYHDGVAIATRTLPFQANKSEYVNYIPNTVN